MQTLGSLPSGRHGLSREEVEASQRTRLLQAAVELGTERGFASLTLTDIVGRARVQTHLKTESRLGRPTIGRGNNPTGPRSTPPSRHGRRRAPTESPPK